MIDVKIKIFMEKLDPKSIWMFFFRFLGFFLALILVFGWLFGTLLVTIADKGMDFSKWLAVFFAVWIILSWVWAKLSYSAYKYQLTEDAFKKESGVIWKRYVSIPYERIQNVDIHRGVLARILGLSDLMIQTAGFSGGYRGGGLGSESEGRLPGVSREKAEQLRDELIRRAKGVKSGV